MEVGLAGCLGKVFSSTHQIRDQGVTNKPGQHMEQTEREKRGITCTVSIGDKIKHATLNYSLGNRRQCPVNAFIILLCFVATCPALVAVPKSYT